MNRLVICKKNITGILLLSLLAVLGLSSCGEGADPMDPDYDRGPLLESVAKNLIIPNFESLQASVDAMSAATNTFVENASEENLSALRVAWVQAVTDHQHCSAFGFGPADLLLGPYGEVLGAWPVSEEKVELNLLNANFDLANSFDVDIRGFYAVEYLIFGDQISDRELIAGFDQDRKDYLLLIINELKTSLDKIVSEWTSSYRDEFIANDGTSAGSSISLFYNGFVKDYENIKNFKVELPAGLSAGIDANGKLVEAYYSGISRDLIVAHFDNIQNIYLGLARSGQDILGLEDYLEELIGGPELIASTKEAIARIDNSIANLPQDRLSEHVESAELEELRDELQANTANFKSSIVSLTGISITFNSGDGD